MMAAQIVITGCGPNWPVKNRSLSDYTVVMQSARTALPIAVEIETLYPNADHFITHFGFRSYPALLKTDGMGYVSSVVLVVVWSREGQRCARQRRVG
jgi:hypothetical protein